MDTRGSHTISSNRGRSSTVYPFASPIRVRLGDDSAIHTTGTGAVRSYATTCASRTRTATSDRSPDWPVAAALSRERAHRPPSKSRSQWQYDDTKADVTALHHHPKHPSDVSSAEGGPENRHKCEIAEYDDADAEGAADGNAAIMRGQRPPQSI
jgi:hypothetical protein